MISDQFRASVCRLKADASARDPDQEPDRHGRLLVAVHDGAEVDHSLCCPVIASGDGIEIAHPRFVVVAERVVLPLAAIEADMANVLAFPLATVLLIDRPSKFALTVPTAPVALSLKLKGPRIIRRQSKPGGRRGDLDTIPGPWLQWGRALP